MSDRLKSTKQNSNEEIIDDLTKEFKKSLSTENETESFVIDPEFKVEDMPSCSGDAPKQATFEDVPLDASDLDRDHQEEEEEKEKEKSDSDSIDEASLKDQEVDLTDDEKAERKIIADELKNVGNEAFKVGDYQRSVEKYTEGLKICPLQFPQQRSILYCNRSAAKMKMENYSAAIKDCSKAIELDDKYLKAYLRRAQSYEKTEKFDESLADYKKILELDPSNSEAYKAAIRLPPIIEERNEKLKNEMIGKLKDLGNMFLKNFGLSTDNFQLEQDPDTKGCIMARCCRRRRKSREICENVLQGTTLLQAAHEPAVDVQDPLPGKNWSLQAVQTQRQALSGTPALLSATPSTTPPPMQAHAPKIQVLVSS